MAERKSTTLERLKELEAKATKGPWKTYGYGTSSVAVACQQNDTNWIGKFTGCGYNDAALIAALRNAAPALLRLWDAAQRQIAHWDECCGCERKPAHEQDECQGEIERALRAALAELDGEVKG